MPSHQRRKLAGCFRVKKVCVVPGLFSMHAQIGKQHRHPKGFALFNGGAPPFGQGGIDQRRTRRASRQTHAGAVPLPGSESYGLTHMHEPMTEAPQSVRDGDNLLLYPRQPPLCCSPFAAIYGAPRSPCGGSCASRTGWADKSNVQVIDSWTQVPDRHHHPISSAVTSRSERLRFCPSTGERRFHNQIGYLRC